MSQQYNFINYYSQSYQATQNDSLPYNQNMLTQSLINSFSRQLSTTLDHVAQDLPKFVTSTNLLGQTSIKPAQKESR